MILKNKEELALKVSELKKGGITIAVCNGSFDLLHSGHLFLISQAKAEAEKLFVLINSDYSVRKYKGNSRPIINQDERAALLDALKNVDFVYIFEEQTPIETLEVIKPEVYVAGPDYGQKCLEKDTVEKYGGKVVAAREKEGALRTSDLIERIAGISSQEKGAVFLDRDGVINIDYGFVGTKERFEFVPGTLGGLKLLNDAGLEVYVISTQSGVGRGYFTAEDVESLTDYMLEEVEKTGGKIHKVSYCLHHPDDKCECRKPNPKMTEDIIKEKGLVARKSYFVSDTKNDLEMAKKLNMKTIWIKSDLNNPKNQINIEPDYIVDNLLEASRIITGLPLKV